MLKSRQGSRTKSNAAIFRLLTGGFPALLDTSGRYLAQSRLSFTIRQLIFSGSFLEAGVKKLATAFSDRTLVNERDRHGLPLLLHTCSG